MKTLSFYCIVSSLAWAGQSFVFNATTQTISNTSVPAQTGAFYWEIYYDVMSSTLTANPYIASATFTNPSTQLLLEFSNGCGTALCLTVSLPNESTGLTGGSVGTGAGFPNSAVIFRIQRDVSSLGVGHSNTDYLDVWDSNGIDRAQSSSAYTAYGTNTAGAAIRGTADGMHLAFIRLCSGAVLPLGSKIPTTAGGCPVGTRVFEWKFDGSLADAGGLYGASLTGGGTTSYANSLYQGAYAAVASYPAPTWSNIISMRAGNQNQLTCGASFSQSDSSNAVTCNWQALSYPALPRFNPLTSTTASPVINILPPTFGDYNIQVSVIDSSGNTGVATADIGAYSSDVNGVIVQSNPAADTLLGPMQCFGCEGWQFHDYLSKYAVDAQYTYLGCCSVPSWAIPLAGTVSYKFCGAGGCSGGTGTHITASMTATQLYAPIADVTKVDVSSFPTTIYVDSEVMLITSCSMSPPTPSSCPGSGATNLIVGYNGRGLYNSQTQYSTVATTHASSANVGQFKVTGTSTKFTTDSVQPMCPAAASSSLPSPIGLPVYSAGTVTMTLGSAPVTATFTNSSASIAATNSFSAGQPVTFTTTGSLPSGFATATVYYVLSTGLSGSAFEVSATLGGTAITAGSAGTGTQSVYGNTSMAGSGVTWNNANGIFNTNLQIVFIMGTTSGTPYSYITWIPVGGLSSTTAIALGSAPPSSTDTGPFSYYILNALLPSLNYTRPWDSSTGRTYQTSLQVCLGDTQMGGIPAHDYGGVSSTINNTLMSAQNYSYSTSVVNSPSSQYVPAFYCTSCMAMAYWLRSGDQKALTLGHWIETYYSPSPAVDSGFTGVYWYTQNGAPLGGYLNLMVDPNTALTTASLRGYGVNAAAQLPSEGCTDDPRDDGVRRSALALGALYDSTYSPISGTYSTFLAALQAAYTMHDVGGALPTGACKMPDNSFSNTTTMGNPVVTGLTLTNGSTAVTGTGITSSMCTTVASGTVSVANNSVNVTSLSGTGFSAASACTPTGNCNLKFLIQQNGGAQEQKNPRELHLDPVCHIAAFLSSEKCF